MKLDRFFKMHIPHSEIESTYKGWVSDRDKVERIARSDRRDPVFIVRDIVTGNIGELGACKYIREFGTECPDPELGILERNSTIWKNDVKDFSGVSIMTSSNKIIIPDAVSVKSQVYSQTKEFNDKLPSWTFQKPTSNRFGDPILLNPNANELVICVWINNVRGDEDNVSCMKPPKDWVWKLKIICFYWPEIYPHLRAPYKKELEDMKKVLYCDDVYDKSVQVIRSKRLAI